MKAKLRLYVWLLFLPISPCAFAQSETAASSPPAGSTSLETFRKEPGIDPKVWKGLGGLDLPSVKEKQGKLPRKWEFAVRSVLLAKPDTPTLVQSEVQLTPLDDGFVLVETQINGESVSSTATELFWLGLVLVHGREATNRQRGALFSGTVSIDTNVTRKLDSLRDFPLQLANLKAGYRWSHDYAIVSEISVKTSLVSRENKVTLNVKQDCEVTPGGSAKDIFPVLTGLFLNIKCSNAADPEASREWTYLEDYAYSIQKRVRTKTNDGEFKVMDVKPR